MCICVFVLTFLSPRSGFQNQAVLDMAITKVKCHIIARTHSTNMTSLLMLTLVIWSRWCLGGLFTVKSLLWICHLLWKKLLYTPNSKTGSYAPIKWEEDFPHKWLNTALGSFLFLSKTYLIIYFYAFVDIDFILWIVNQYYFMFSSNFSTCVAWELFQQAPTSLAFLHQYTIFWVWRHFLIFWLQAHLTSFLPQYWG